MSTQSEPEVRRPGVPPRSWVDSQRVRPVADIDERPQRVVPRIPVDAPALATVMAGTTKIDLVQGGPRRIVVRITAPASRQPLFFGLFTDQLAEFIAALQDARSKLESPQPRGNR